MRFLVEYMSRLGVLRDFVQRRIFTSGGTSLVLFVFLPEL